MMICSKAKFLAALSVGCALILSAPFYANASDEDFGYLGYEKASANNPTVQGLLEALKQNPNAIVQVQEGWTIVELQTETEMSLWSFAPSTHPAHPAVAERRVFQQDGNVYIETDIKCEAAKAECDAFARSFQQLNQQMQQGR